MGLRYENATSGMSLLCRIPAAIAMTSSIVVPRSSARCEAAWMTGPSAIGSEKGTPSSISVRAGGFERERDVDRSRHPRFAARDVRDEAAAVLALHPLERVTDAVSVRSRCEYVGWIRPDPSGACPEEREARREGSG